MTTEMRFQSFACSHPGLVRRHNEDAYLERGDIGLWAVADGMGGMTAGDVASQAVVRALGTISPQPSGAAFVAAIKDRLAEVNGELRALAASRNAPTAIGATVAGLLIFAEHFACFWAGDSRVYRLRGNELDRLTRDHSLVQDMIDAGQLAPDKAEAHPHASVINRAIGAEDGLELEFTHARIQPDDLFLVCSDGLTRMVSDQELEHELGHLPPAEARDRLLAMVLERGAKDNVTLILIHCLAMPKDEVGPSSGYLP